MGVIIAAHATILTGRRIADLFAAIITAVAVFAVRTKWVGFATDPMLWARTGVVGTATEECSGELGPGAIEIRVV